MLINKYPIKPLVHKKGPCSRKNFRFSVRTHKTGIGPAGQGGGIKHLPALSLPVDGNRSVGAGVSAVEMLHPLGEDRLQDDMP